MSTDQTGLTEEDLWTQVMSGKQAEQDDAVKEEGSPAEVEETKKESEPVEPDQGKKIEIQAAIVVERESQKKIVIGAGGEKIKQIGIDARKDIESFLGRKVVLKLWVRVRENWKDNPGLLKEYGY